MQPYSLAAELLQTDTAASLVRAYHERTKHRVGRYASGPQTLDWDAQPAPFRRYVGAKVQPLTLLSELPGEHPIVAAFAQPFKLGASRLHQSIDWDLDALSVLLQASLGITAWKLAGPDRWAVRANPSSGNLHPVEAYVISCGSALLADGVYHYCPERHALEQRACWSGVGEAGSGLFIALSSVMWREAWKYGERAFRYCQLDTGHAVASLSVAAAILGARLREETPIAVPTLACLLGLEHDASGQRPTEREEPELLMRIVLPGSSASPVPLTALTSERMRARFVGQPSLIDARPLYCWPVLEQVALATRGLGRARPVFAMLEGARDAANSPSWPVQHHELGRERSRLVRAAPTSGICDGDSPRSAQDVLLGRRSAQRFDVTHVMSQADFFGMLQTLQPQASAPWTALARAPKIDLLLFVHRVEGMESGLYLLRRRGAESMALIALLARRFLPCSVPGAPPRLMLLRAVPTQDLMRLTRALHCNQEIAATGCFSLGMLSEFAGPLAGRAAAYREIHREAGVVGQMLYLGAEARGVRGTGIGCFFDDDVHALIGLKDARYQSLYHFTVGKPVDDARIETGAAYPDRT